ncbi:MAG: spore coat protein CotJB [Pseudoflavonifractor sp.]
MHSISNDKPGDCTDRFGVLPCCAPLAVPYVPFQQPGSQKYDQKDAINNGTLFPGLNLPFHLKAEAANVVNGAMTELQALNFVLLELALYLDTHQNDTEAFELYRQYGAMESEGRAKYEALYGPLTHAAAAVGKSYAWLDESWPWTYSEGGVK